NLSIKTEYIVSRTSTSNDLGSKMFNLSITRIWFSPSISILINLTTRSLILFAYLMFSASTEISTLDSGVKILLASVLLKAIITLFVPLESSLGYFDLFIFKFYKFLLFKIFKL